jgi:serine/tyrosine/threonine adenylyltransferase
MDQVNPVYVPRNHVVEEVLTAASWGDIQAFEELLDVVTHPFDERPGFERFAQPAPVEHAESYRTFCGT